MSNSMDYTIGDSVLIQSDELKKKVIGCIEEIDVVEGSFRYGLYVSSKEIQKRQYYHGNFELLKTSSSFEDKLANIEKCVEVLKFKEYAMRDQPTEQQPYYVIRQYYDMQEQSLTPSDPKPCICNRVVNPDGNLIMCLNCTDLFYHDTCLVPGAKCQGCMSVLKEESFVGVKRTQTVAQLPTEVLLEPITIKQLSNPRLFDEDLHEEIEPSKTNIDLGMMKEMFEQTRLANQKKQEEKRKQMALQKATNHAINKQNLQLKREKSGGASSASSSNVEFSNLSASDNERIQTFVNRYKRFNPTGNLVGPEKKRMEVREKFFEYMVYGLLEMETSESILSDDERRFIKQDFYEIARKLAVEIESNIFNVNNRSNKYALTDNYKQRCKLLFLNMRDNLNFQLRRRVINKTIKPLSLCSMSEIDLYNPTKLKEIENQQFKMLDRDTISLQDKIIVLKTSKGEEIIARKEDINIQIEDENTEPNTNYSTMNSRSRHTSTSKQDTFDVLGELSQNSMNMMQSKDGLCYSKNKNHQIDQSIIDSLTNFIGEKGLKRIKDRVLSDLPEREASFLISKLFN